jgi:cell division protein FtsQ
MILGRKQNRRRVESPLSRLKLPVLGLNWRKRLRIALVIPLAAAALYGVLTGATAVLDQPVRKLVVEGTFQRVTPIQVEAAVADSLGRGFLSLDLGRLREHVQTLDWVDRVNVGRSWPDTLIVRVTEHQAAARWGDEGLLNVRGELFAKHARHAFPELPSLAGPEGSEQDVARRYLAVRGRLAEADLTLERLSMDERGAWSLVLDVVAPALAAELGRVRYVDLRYTNGFAVGWRTAENAALATTQGVPDRG